MRFLTALLVLLVLVGNRALAQAALDAQQTGTVVLANGDTLDGAFTVNLPNDVVQVNIENTIKTYSSRQVQYFYFEEPETKITRLFYSFPYALRTGYKVPAFFEIVFSGPFISLLTRESKVVETLPTYDAFTGRSIMGTRTRIINDFYFRKPTGEVVRYRFKKKELFALMKDKEKDIKEYMAENHLNFVERESLTRITDYYNYLKRNSAEGNKTP